MAPEHLRPESMFQDHRISLPGIAINLSESAVADLLGIDVHSLMTWRGRGFIRPDKASHGGHYCYSHELIVRVAAITVILGNGETTLDTLDFALRDADYLTYYQEQILDLLYPD